MPRISACARASASCWASGRSSPRSMCAAARRARARPTCSIRPAASIASMRSASAAARPSASRAADGVMRWLREHGRGVAVGGVVVPIVPTRDPVRPAEWRRQGLGLAALSRARLPGDAAAPRATSRWAMPAPAWAPRPAISRAGWAAPRRSIRATGLQVGALVAVNAARLHDHGRHAAVLGLGAGAGRRVRRPAAAPQGVALPVSHGRADLTHDPADAARSDPRANTTIAVVATNARLDKAVGRAASRSWRRTGSPARSARCTRRRTATPSSPSPPARTISAPIPAPGRARHAGRGLPGPRRGARRLPRRDARARRAAGGTCSV